MINSCRPNLQVPGRKGSQPGTAGRGGLAGVAGRKVHHLCVPGNPKELRVCQHVRLRPDEAGRDRRSEEI